MVDEALKIAGESCQRGPAEIDCEMPCAMTVPALVDFPRTPTWLWWAASVPARYGAVIWVR